MKMFNREISREAFLNWNDTSTSVMMQNTRIGHKGIHFFNFFCGSSITECTRDMCWMSDDALMLVNMRKEKTPGSYFVKGQIKWISEKRT